MARELFFVGVCAAVLVACTESPSGEVLPDKAVNSAVLGPKAVVSSADMIAQSKALLRSDALEPEGDQLLFEDDHQAIKLQGMFDSKPESSRVSIGAKPILTFAESVTDLPSVDGASVDISIKID